MSVDGVLAEHNGADQYAAFVASDLGLISAHQAE